MTVIRALAEYLVSDAFHKSAMLAAENRDAIAWAAARQACGICGMARIDEAEAAIKETLRREAFP